MSKQMCLCAMYICMYEMLLQRSSAMYIQLDVVPSLYCKEVCPYCVSASNYQFLCVQKAYLTVLLYTNSTNLKESQVLTLKQTIFKPRVSDIS